MYFKESSDFCFTIFISRNDWKSPRKFDLRELWDYKEADVVKFCPKRKQTYSPLADKRVSFDFAVDRYASKRVGTFFSFYGIFKLLWKYESDHRSYEHYLSSKNKAWKKFRLERELNSWPLQYRGKLTGSWSFFFLVKHQHVNYRTYVYVIGDELCSFVSR